MTPYDMRRLADQKESAADRLEDNGERLRRAGDALRGLLDPLVPMSQRVWKGPAADDFERQVKVHAGQLHEQSAALALAASRLQREASIARSDAQRLRSQADAAEAEIVAAAFSGPA